MKSYTSVEHYLKAQNESEKEKLNQIRDIVFSTVKDVEENISYGMPSYTWKGRPLFYFASMKNHIGIYPTPGPIKTLNERLVKWSTSKGCIRIKKTEQIPTSIIKLLLKERQKEIKDELKQNAKN